MSEKETVDQLTSLNKEIADLCLEREQIICDLRVASNEVIRVMERLEAVTSMREKFLKKLKEIRKEIDESVSLRDTISSQLNNNQPKEK